MRTWLEILVEFIGRILALIFGIALAPFRAATSATNMALAENVEAVDDIESLDDLLGEMKRRAMPVRALGAPAARPATRTPTPRSVADEEQFDDEVPAFAP
jgi:hypothetical protein